MKNKFSYYNGLYNIRVSLKGSSLYLTWLDRFRTAYIRVCP